MFVSSSVDNLHIGSKHQQHQQRANEAASVSRREALLAATAAVALAPQLYGIQSAHAAGTLKQLADASSTTTSSSSSSSQELQLYENSKQQYRMQVPVAWERKEKAGADVLFEDPDRRSTSVGVTVSPVRVASIGQFGDLAAVGQRLLEAERKKESTLDVQLLTSSQRQGSNGATLYDYEYELDSTRGKKRIFNTVTIEGSKLYILNGNFKCDKEAGCSTDDATNTLAVLRQVAGSFDAGSSG